MKHVHVIDLPRRIVIGYRVLDHIAKHIVELGLGENIVLVSGPSMTKSYAKRVIDVLVDKGFNVSHVIVDNASIDEAMRILEEFKDDNVEIVIGVGGGKAIDIAKYVAYNLNAKLISIPTAPSHDGIASPFASIKGLDKPTSIKTIMPSLVVADIEIISKAPRRLIIAGCGDLIGKFTSVLDWRLAYKLRGEYYGEYAASLALLSAKHVVKYSEWFSFKTIPSEAVRALVEALISSGIAMGIAGSTRPASGSEHLFAHALDVVANYPALHGEEVGVGTIMMMYLHGKNWRKIKRVLKRIGAPTTAKELGVKDDDIIKALTLAHKIRPRYTILGEKGLTVEAAENLARITGVIQG